MNNIKAVKAADASRPIQMLPVMTTTIEPRKAKCQKFQISMFKVLVKPNTR